MKKKADALMEGAVDIHAHAYPEHTLKTEPRVDSLEWARLAKEFGMKGFVMKSHIWPTAIQAYEVRKMVEGIEVMGSITLNFTVGGLSESAVAIAGELGAKVVFMPTWSARNDISKSGVMLNRIRKICPLIDKTIEKEGGGIYILDENGEVKPVLRDILEIAKSYDMAVSSGHLSVEESIKLAAMARQVGVRFFLSHPHNKTISATVEQQKQIAALGGYIEHTFIACMPMHLRVNPRDIAESIRAVGVDKSVITSDAFGPWNPPAPEVFRMFVRTLLELGFSDEEISAIARENPARLVGL
jgi:hypothetical protein